MAEPGMSTKRAIAGAVLLDLAVSPLFAWDVFTDSLRRDLGTDDTLLAGVFSVGLLTFMVGVLVGGRVADSVSPRRLALVTAGGVVFGLLGSVAATSVATMTVAFGVLVGGSTGLGYATAVRVAGTVRSRRGLALGLVVSAYAAGTAVLARWRRRCSWPSAVAGPSCCWPLYSVASSPRRQCSSPAARPPRTRHGVGPLFARAGSSSRSG